MGSLALGLTALSLSTGCADLLGEQDTDGHFRIAPQDDGTFFGWTEITIDEDPYDVDGATLTRAALEARDGANDLTFVQHVVGEVVTPEKRTPMARGFDFPPNDTIADMDIIYDDDLRPLFVAHDDGSTIRIEWKGTVNPDHVFDDDGYEVGVLITVDIE
jgi:hypothetical protein